MNKFIKILWLPVVILTMALTGAFTVNAGNIVTEDNQSEQSTLATTPYHGAVYYFDIAINDYVYLGNGDGSCTLDDDRQPECQRSVDGIWENLYGIDPSTSDYAPLFQMIE
ncbi:hypothetical protein [Myroides indicus]|uniref:Uncharacterized protein n=1 Tax=Myroides indicus TaxID=1323422 RepID=A0A4R7F7C9_9FLAO|nr:hypothetical protein [Myroides indicus]TDS66224.1 hypothetical protein C8P70_101121 [Myroides indicus]